MWCLMAPHEQKHIDEVSVAHREQQTIEILKTAHLGILDEGLNEPQDNHGVVGFSMLHINA